MRSRTLLLSALTTLGLAALACTGMGDAEPSTDDATQAGEIAKAIDADPTSAETILSAKGTDADSYDKLLYAIAMDASLSRSYVAAFGTSSKTTTKEQKKKRQPRESE